MKITADEGSKLGYIYLMPGDKEKNWESQTNLCIFDEDDIKIPLLVDENMANRLNNLNFIDKSFWEAWKNEDFNLQWPCDSKEGYIKGIELEMRPSNLMAYIRQGVYKVYKLNWRRTEYHLVMVDRNRDVFSETSTIYPVNDNMDVFVIVVNKGKCHNIGALISSREDLYPVDYLTTPRFFGY